MRILFIGDIFGKVGRRAVSEIAPVLRKEKGIDRIFANAENICGGAGIDRKRLDELFGSGVDACTSGNHTWHNKAVYDFIDKEPRLVRPANLPEPCPGRPYTIMDGPNGEPIALTNLLGRLFMESCDCPFKRADSLLKELEGQARIILVDFHAEATSEKIAMGHYLNGRVTALLGTHTHVQTADEGILSEGTAYITDLGMTGPHDSVIGVRKEDVLERFLTCRPVRYSASRQGGLLNGVIVDIEPESGKATAIERVRLPLA